MVLPNSLAIPEETLSVAGLTAYIQALLEQDAYLSQIWVTGEISSAGDRGGHQFFTLREPDGSAAVNCVAWRSHRRHLVADPTPGEQVVVLGQVRLYPQRGHYQLRVVQLLPAGTGLQALRRQQRQARLAAEGLFDAAIKRPLPPYPHTIGVVTSPHAAAWGDIQRTLRQRHPGLRVLLAAATVQGPQAPAAIARALAQVAEDGRAELVIVARGGGAREDLDSFDDEQVVRAIATCPMPVVTGIGHQRDESLADLAADAWAHTPTAAAEQAVPALTDLWQQHQTRSRNLRAALQSAVQMHYERVADMRRRIEQLKLDQQIQGEQQRLHWQQQRLTQTVQYRLQSAQQHCAGLQQTLKSLDPTAVLQRGYALVRRSSGSLVSRTDQVQPGDTVQIQLGDGQLTATVDRRTDAG